MIFDWGIRSNWYRLLITFGEYDTESPRPRYARPPPFRQGGRWFVRLTFCSDKQEFMESVGINGGTIYKMFAIVSLAVQKWAVSYRQKGCGSREPHLSETSFLPLFFFPSEKAAYLLVRGFFTGAWYALTIRTECGGCRYPPAPPGSVTGGRGGFFCGRVVRADNLCLMAGWLSNVSRLRPVR